MLQSLSSESRARRSEEEDNSAVVVVAETEVDYSKVVERGTAAATSIDKELTTTLEIIDTTCCGDDRIIHSINSSIGDESAIDDSSCPHRVEIKHLKHRIKNVREISIQTSRDAIASDLTKYQNNVLNATRNCVNEWRSIARHYNNIDRNDDDDDDDYNDDSNNINKCAISSALRKETGLLVFELIQLSVQSGPLTGSKPGYFKRCGAEVARVVLDFLEEAVPQHDALGVDCMGFSSKQMDVMQKWKRNAEKAVENDKPPSKSVSKNFDKRQRQNSKTKKK